MSPGWSASHISYDDSAFSFFVSFISIVREISTKKEWKDESGDGSLKNSDGENLDAHANQEAEKLK